MLFKNAIVFLFASKFIISVFNCQAKGVVLGKIKCVRVFRIQEGNPYVPQFVIKFNRRFALVQMDQIGYV